MHEEGESDLNGPYGHATTTIAVGVVSGAS